MARVPPNGARVFDFVKEGQSNRLHCAPRGDRNQIGDGKRIPFARQTDPQKALGLLSRTPDYWVRNLIIVSAGAAGPAEFLIFNLSFHFITLYSPVYPT
jgi:hypothetical protein